MPRNCNWTYLYFSRCLFDETLFPFAKLHPNVGALLRAEIAFLPDYDIVSDHGGELSKVDHVNKSIENCSSNNSCAVVAHDFMCTYAANTDVAHPEEDLANRRSGALSEEIPSAGAMIGARS